MSPLKISSRAKTDGRYCSRFHSVGTVRAGIIICKAVGAKLGTSVTFEVKLPPQDDLSWREFFGDPLFVWECIEEHDRV